MTAHAAASTTANELRQWTPVAGSADADLLGERGTLVARSRDLTRNHGVAQGAMQTVTDNVVGTGLRLSSKPRYKLLGRDAAWAREFSQTAEGWFAMWGEDSGCDVQDQLDFAGLQAQAVRSLWMNGEACAVPMWMPEPGRVFSTKLLLVEADRLSNPKGQTSTRTLRDGVEMNEYGRPLAYHVRKHHPGDRFAFGMVGAVSDEWERIPARTAWGRRRFIHLHDKDRSGQTRGKPLITAVMKQFKMLDHYQTTELQAAIVNALIAAFIKTPLDQESIVELFGGNAEAANKYLESKNEHRVQLKGGAILPLFPGDEVQAFTPSRPAAGFDAFVMSVYRIIAAGLNLPYELLLKDFTKTNYSSARAALLEAWRYFLGLRKKVGQMFCQAAYELVLEEMVDQGLVDAPDYYTLHRAYAYAKWIGPGRGWVDPVKEAQAAQIRMDTNLSTLEMECAEQGLDWEEVLEQRALEKARIKELGLEEDYIRSASRPIQNEPRDKGDGDSEPADAPKDKETADA